MIPLRWRKIIQDIRNDKARTMMVILSIMISVVVLGMLEQANARVTQAMIQSYEKAAPSSATLLTDPFDDTLLATIKQMPPIRNVQGSTIIPVKVAPEVFKTKEPSPESWRKTTIHAFKTYKSLPMDQIYPHAGAWPPSSDGIVLERTALDSLGVKIGQFLTIKMTDGKTHTLRIVGTLYAPGEIPAVMSDTLHAYISWDMLQTLRIPAAYNSLSFTVNKYPTELRHIEKVTAKVRERVIESNHAVSSSYIPIPGKHWAYDIVQSIAIILKNLGFLMTIMGSTLVFNTILATLTGQIRQIGIMKVFGATRGDLLLMYLSMVLVYCVVALAIGIPLAQQGALYITGNAYTLANFVVTNTTLSLSTIVWCLGVGLLIPILASLYPILRGTNISIRDAIQGYRIGGGFGSGVIDRVIQGITIFSRPFLLSLRNTFRQKLRLTLTLITLSAGGAMTISVFSVYSSMQLTVERSLKYLQYDVRVIFSEAQRTADIAQITSHIPGVVATQSWGQATSNIVFENGRESQDISLISLPTDSRFIIPQIYQGRWLNKRDAKAVVLDSFVLQVEPNIRLDDIVTFKVNGKKQKFRVVGFTRKSSGNPKAFVSDVALPFVMNGEGVTNMLQLVTSDHSRNAQARTAEQIESLLKDKGVYVSTTVLTSDVQRIEKMNMNVVLAFLVMMGVFLTVVAAIGLTGSMSIAVLERMREFGILRSIGASDKAIWRIVTMESMLIGGISWVLSSLLALPFSRALSDAIGNSLHHTPLEYTFPISGVIIWFFVALLLSALASFVPAWRASRLEIRDVLNHQ